MHPLDLGQPPHRRKTAPWVIVTGILFLLVAFYFTWSTLSYSDLEAPVQKQLSSIRQGKIPEAYYEYTSNQFQAATSLDQFREFVSSHSVLRDNRSGVFESPEIEDNLGRLRGVLHATNGEEAPIQYVLERQDAEWRILNMQLSAISDAARPAAELSSKQEKELYAPINAQLVLLKEGKDREAYDQVSSGFKNATSFEQFSTFLSRFPVLKENTGHAFRERAIEEDRAAVRVDLLLGDKTIPLEYHLVKENGEWKIWSIQVLIPQNGAPDSSLMIAPVQEQLEALKDKDIKEAYSDYVSSEFKKTTSLKKFEDFVDKFRIFTNYTKVDYKQPRMEETGGKLMVVLHNEKGESAAVEYTLGIENGEWKIWGFRLVSHSKNGDKSAEDFSADTLAAIANAQLAAIKAGKFDSAYSDFTSPQFQQATSLEVFKQFLTSYPIFTNYQKADFSKLMVNNNIATLTGLFTDPKGIQTEVEYDFTLDGDQWKILRIQVVADKGAENLTHFPKIVVGNEINDQGAVTNETTVITDTKKNIYANIFVNGKKGETITVVFKHLDTGSSIKPITSTPMPKDGIFRTAFSFNPPPQGWPAGKYALEISSSTGQEETYTFDIKN